MGTFINSEDQDEMPTLFVMVKKIVRQKIQLFKKNYNLTPLDMQYPKFIVLNPKE